jgi:hypothetical protein
MLCLVLFCWLSCVGYSSYTSVLVVSVPQLNVGCLNLSSFSDVSSVVLTFLVQLQFRLSWSSLFCLVHVRGA